MQINVLLLKTSDQQADTIRKRWYKTTTSQQTRDAFVYNECIDRYKGKPEELLPYIERDEGSETIQRKVTIKRESYDRLVTIASAINKPTTTTYRAIIAYTIDHLPEEEDDVAEPVGLSQLLMEKIAQLEKQVEAFNQTLEEIKKLVKE